MSIFYWIIITYRFKSKKLFTSGLYKVSRNPLYVSLLFLLISIGLLTMPFLLIVTIPLLVLLLNIIIKNEKKPIIIFAI